MANREWSDGVSTRGKHFEYCKKKHVNLEDIKEDHNETNPYLKSPSIPLCPHPMLFKVRTVCHVTGTTGLKGILRAGGFKAFNNSKLHWSLFVTKEDISEAQHRCFGNSDLHCDDNCSLRKFTTSPAFQEESRYGNFRFTFSVRQLLHFYSKQFCSSTAPVLRILNTELYKQEIVYTILVHPKYMWHYKKYPRLPLDDAICGYKDGMVSWQCQSPADNYKHELNNNGVYPVDPKYFVWDHVTLVFHVKPHQTLKVPYKLLIKSVTVCEMPEKVNLLMPPDKKLSVSEATEILENFKRKIFNI